MRRPVDRRWETAVVRFLRAYADKYVAYVYVGNDVSWTGAHCGGLSMDVYVLIWLLQQCMASVYE